MGRWLCTRGAPGTAGPRQRCGGVSARPRPLGASVAAPASPRPESPPPGYTRPTGMFTAARARTPAAGEARAHLPSPAPRKRRPGRSQAPRKGLRHGSVPIGFKPGSPPREAGRAAAPRRSRGRAGRGRLPGKVGFVARLLGQGVCDLLVKGHEAVNEGRKRVFFWLDVMLEKNFPLFLNLQLLPLFFFKPRLDFLFKFPFNIHVNEFYKDS